MVNGVKVEPRSKVKQMSSDRFIGDASDFVSTSIEQYDDSPLEDVEVAPDEPDDEGAED